MSIKIPKPALFILAFIVSLALYWPSMNGTPIWDDNTFWFRDPVMTDSVTYTEIWLRFAWPFSVSLQKLLLTFFKKEYFFYHLFNFLLHFCNSILVYKIARYLRLRYSYFVFLLFLVHPICVISAAWMIQIKTLLCLFFALSATLTFLKGQKDIRWMMLSWLLFALSITSKSASITLPLILLVVSFKTFRFRKLALLIPFFLFSGASTYRVLTSKVTIEGTEKAAKVTTVKSEPKKEVELEPKIEPKTLPKESPKPVAQAPKEILPKKVAINNTSIKKDSWFNLSFIKVNWQLMLQTLHYYFWQSIIPFDNAPVKGLNYDTAGFIEFVHVFFLVCLIIIFYKDLGLVFLGSAHFLLLPFIGIMPAPYMNVTWVSDQHLYLVLPALIYFWVRVVERIPWKYRAFIPAIILIFFSYKTFEASKHYRSEIAFFESSLESNPYNVPIAYNLSYAYLFSQKTNEALALLDKTVLLAEEEPALKKNIYFPYLMTLYINLQSSSNED